jgi:hypothetical protein
MVGVGMRSHAGIASKMFRTLADENINIRMISTSEIKISVVVDEKYSGTRRAHSAFRIRPGERQQASQGASERGSYCLSTASVAGAPLSHMEKRYADINQTGWRVIDDR